MIIREAVPADAKGIARVHVDSWRTTYKDIIPASVLDGLSYEAREQLWKQNIPEGHNFVAEAEDGRIIGFSSGGKERSGKYAGYEGEISAVYLLETYQGQGIGRKLMAPVVKVLSEMQCSGMLVMVLEDNPACRFYEATGGKLIDTVDMEIGGVTLKERVYGWEDIRSFDKGKPGWLKEDRVMLDEAVKLIEAGKNEEAIPVLLKLAEEFPEDQEVLFHCAEAHDGSGLEKEAVPFYERALTLGIEGEMKERAYIQLGSSLRCIGRYKEAVHIFEKGLEEFPENNALHVFMAMSLYNVKDSERAVQILIKTVLNTTSDDWINKYSRALDFYSDNLDETW